MDRAARSIEIIDEIKGGSHDARLAFHLGPDVQAELDGSVATLSWTTGPAQGEARLTLPAELRWSLHRGETAPVLGWYSAGLGHRVPAWTLLGAGRSTPGGAVITRLQFAASESISGRSTPRQTAAEGR